MVCRDRLLIGPPLFDDLRSSRSNTTSCAACANGWLVDACRREQRALGPVVTRRDGYQGIASPPIVDPEAIVRPPFPAPRLSQGARQPDCLSRPPPVSWMDPLVRPIS